MARLTKDAPKTDPELLQLLLEKAKNYYMTPRDFWLQRVSFVYGNLPEGNTTTREEVERLVTEFYGPCPEE